MPGIIKVLEITKKKNRIQRTLTELIVPNKLILANTRGIALLDKTDNDEQLEINYIHILHYNIQELMKYFIENSRKLSHLLNLIKLFIETNCCLTICHKKNSPIKIDFSVYNSTLIFSSYKELNNFIKNNVFYENIEPSSINLITFEGKKNRLNEIRNKLAKIINILDLDILYMTNKYELIDIDYRTDEEIINMFLWYLHINGKQYDTIKNLITLEHF